MRAMNRQQLDALLLLSGIDGSKVYQLANQYWPDVPDYATLRTESPWWLVMTPLGGIVLGWRKRVLEIRWEDTPLRKEITTDDTTSTVTFAHAWTLAKAVEYLTTLRHALADIAYTKEWESANANAAAA